MIGGRHELVSSYFRYRSLWLHRMAPSCPDLGDPDRYCTDAFLALLVQKAEEAIRTKKVKFLPRMLIVFLLLCVILAGFALRPPVTCGDGVCTDLTPDLRETVRSVSSGLYSWNVPLVPICVRITETEDFVVNGVTEHRVEFDVYYFCFGRLGMEYSTCDGFNIATPIFRS